MAPSPATVARRAKAAARRVHHVGKMDLLLEQIRMLRDLRMRSATQVLC